MRARTVFVGALVVNLFTLGMLVWLAGHQEPVNSASRETSKSQLSPTPTLQTVDSFAADAAELRAIVAEHEIATMYWAPGGVDPESTFNRFRVLHLPQGVKVIFERNPHATLQVLKTIVESGSADDAHTAIAYAHAAVGYAHDDPVPLLHAHSYAFHPEAKQFDKMHSVIPKTYRQFAVEEIDGIISEEVRLQRQKAPH